MDTVEDSGLKFFWAAAASQSPVSERRLLKWAVLKMWTPRQGSPRNLGLAVADYQCLKSLDTRLLEIACVPVRLEHVARFIVKANHSAVERIDIRQSCSPRR